MRTLALTAASLILLVADPVLACSCMAIEPAEAFEQADAVFEGRVRAIDRSETSLRVTLDVVQHWKGIDSEQVIVETASNSAACGVAFELETSWLVYATREGGGLRAGLCSRTARIEDAQADVAALGAGVVPVEIGPDDEVEPPAAEPPARGGCASCSVSSRRVDYRAIAGTLAIALALVIRRARRKR